MKALSYSFKLQNFGLLVFTILLSFLALSCGRRDAATAGNAGAGSPTTPKSVRVGRTERRQLIQTVIAPGTLAADEQATVSFKVAGRLEQINVDLGSTVRRGQTIAQLETNDFRVRLQQAEAALQQARVRLGLPAT
ncbi:MAG: biotin/lipoyl-binding protein, partial [Acidobacteria bacterium]|nr:biotin/lipoyl-binding protein [Acidobacteriota bacterium]